MRNVVDVVRLEQKVKDIHFSNFKNTIHVSDQKVIIPAMRLPSSALELMIEGIHSFDQKIDYQFDFFLSDLMKKKGAEQFEEFEIEPQTDRKWFKLSMQASGTVEEPLFSWNRKKQKQIIKDKIKSERSLLKQLIKEEFNEENRERNQEESDAVLEFDHPSVPKPKAEHTMPQEPQEQKPKKNTFMGIDLGAEEEELEEVDIDNL